MLLSADANCQVMVQKREEAGITPGLSAASQSLAVHALR